MYPSRPFKPIAGATVSIAASTASGRVALGSVASEYRLFANSTAPVWVEFGDSSVTAASTLSMPLQAAVAAVFRPSVHTHTHLAVISVSTAAPTIYATPGEGGI
jgi:hypothetical protein